MAARRRGSQPRQPPLKGRVDEAGPRTSANTRTGTRVPEGVPSPVENAALDPHALVLRTTGRGPPSLVSRPGLRHQTMPKPSRIATALFGLLFVGAASPGLSPLSAQQPELQPRLLVFLDCQTRDCNQNEFRSEIDFVDWVREREASDVHVIMTSQGAGAGTEYVFDFVGSGDLLGSDVSLRYTASVTSTQDEVLGGLTRTLAAGLAGYAARLGYAPLLEIRGRESESEAPAIPREDPWNLWVFEVGGDLEFEGEEREESYEIGGLMSANRTTEDWRVEVELGGTFSERKVELNDGREFVRKQDEWEFETLVVKSIANQWSAGFDVEANTSTQSNRKLGARAAAALEWSYFPYADANRRQFVVQYQLGLARVRYEEETIFDKTEETLADHRLAAVYQVRQPWGDISFSTGWTNYLHDWEKFALAVGVDFAVRLFRGFELTIDGGYEIIRNQLYIPAEDLSDEEILVQQRALATGYEYNLEVGLRYRFGSIFNNVVNNRFPWSVRNF